MVTIGLFIGCRTGYDQPYRYDHLIYAQSVAKLLQRTQNCRSSIYPQLLWSDSPNFYHGVHSIKRTENTYSPTDIEETKH